MGMDSEVASWEASFEAKLSACGSHFQSWIAEPRTMASNVVMSMSLLDVEPGEDNGDCAGLQRGWRTVVSLSVGVGVVDVGADAEVSRVEMCSAILWVVPVALA